MFTNAAHRRTGAPQRRTDVDRRPTDTQRNLQPLRQKSAAGYGNCQIYGCWRRCADGPKSLIFRPLNEPNCRKISHFLHSPPAAPVGARPVSRSGVLQCEARRRPKMQPTFFHRARGRAGAPDFFYLRRTGVRCLATSIAGALLLPTSRETAAVSAGAAALVLTLSVCYVALGHAMSALSNPESC